MLPVGKLAGSIAVLVVLGSAEDAASQLPWGKAPSYEKLVSQGDPVLNGMADVSVEYGSDGVGWMAYSRVALPKGVSTHLATSRDHGKSWTFVSAVNPSADGAHSFGRKKLAGAWRYETSTLLFDPTDEPARRWKLFVERYLSTPPHRKANYALGWIEVRFAQDPAGRWSEPVRLLGHSPGESAVNLNALHPDLAKVAFYNELGSIIVDDVIYLSMDASPTSSGLGKWKDRKIILIASDDHGRSWRYVGTLTDHDDASSLGYLTFTGSSLVRAGGSVFFMFTPAGAKNLFKKVKGHDGTYIVPFEDIAHAKLKRDAQGKLQARKLLDVFLTSGGQGDYDEQNTHSGILFSQRSPSARPEFFQSFHSKLRLP